MGLRKVLSRLNSLLTNTCRHTLIRKGLYPNLNYTYILDCYRYFFFGLKVSSCYGGPRIRYLKEFWSDFDNFWTQDDIP